MQYNCMTSCAHCRCNSWLYHHFDCDYCVMSGCCFSLYQEGERLWNRWGVYCTESVNKFSEHYISTPCLVPCMATVMEYVTCFGNGAQKSFSHRAPPGSTNADKWSLCHCSEVIWQDQDTALPCIWASSHWDIGCKTELVRQHNTVHFDCNYSLCIVCVLISHSHELHYNVIYKVRTVSCWTWDALWEIY